MEEESIGDDELDVNDNAVVDVEHMKMSQTEPERIMRVTRITTSTGETTTFYGDDENREVWNRRMGSQNRKLVARERDRVWANRQRQLFYRREIMRENVVRGGTEQSSAESSSDMHRSLDSNDTHHFRDDMEEEEHYNLDEDGNRYLEDESGEWET